jgi:hypothetical protein
MGKSTVSARVKPRDVYLSDFVQDSGTPLQWLCAWETIAELEYAAWRLHWGLYQLALMRLALDGRWPLVTVLGALKEAA